jgi:hypothetical protein
MLLCYCLTFISPFVQLFEGQFWDDKAQWQQGAVRVAARQCGSKAQCAGVKGGKAQSGGGMAQSKGEGANERRQINGWLTHPSASGQPAQCN